LELEQQKKLELEQLHKINSRARESEIIRTAGERKIRSIKNKKKKKESENNSKRERRD